MSADLPTIDYLDELVDTDPARLLDEAIALRARAERAEAAIGRVRALHHIHRCHVDGHAFDHTPTPCLNDGICQGCGRRECETLAELDGPAALSADIHARTAASEKQTEPVRHLGGNAEDCPACDITTLPYPFLCPGEDPTTEEISPDA